MKKRDKYMSFIGLLAGLVLLILASTNSFVANALIYFIEAVFAVVVRVYNFFLRLFGVY